MIESLLSVVGQRGVDALAFLLAFALTALMDSVFHDKLPQRFCWHLRSLRLPIRCSTTSFPTTMAVNLPSMAACPRARPAVPA